MAYSKISREYLRKQILAGKDYEFKPKKGTGIAVEVFSINKPVFSKAFGKYRLVQYNESHFGGRKILVTHTIEADDRETVFQLVASELERMGYLKAITI